MDSPKISVIVPVYNVEKELLRCIQSIISQTFKEYEVLLIDDGSTDNSSAICDKYAKEYCFISCVHKKNGGLSSARNAGVKLARAKWITFIDSDDYILPTYLERLWKGITDYNADIAVCNKRAPFFKNKINKKEEAFSSMTALQEILYQKGSDVSAWGKLFRIEYARMWPFPEGYVYEDILPVTRIFCEAHTIVFIYEELYCYINRAGSISNSSTYKAWHDERLMTDQMFQFIKEDCVEAIPAARSKCFSNYCQLMLKAKRANIENDDQKNVLLFLKDTSKIIFKDTNCRLKNRIAALFIFLFL